MANYNINIDLLKVSGAFAANIKGKTSTRKCICIPIEDTAATAIFVGEKGVWLNLTAVEMKEPKFEDTHFIKPRFDKEVYEKMTEEQRKNTPILGGLREAKHEQKQMAVTATAAVEEIDDLPF